MGEFCDIFCFGVYSVREFMKYFLHVSLCNALGGPFYTSRFRLCGEGGVTSLCGVDDQQGLTINDFIAREGPTPSHPVRLKPVVFQPAGYYCTYPMTATVE